MQTVLLAAGRGTRMWPLTDAHPKPMLPVAGKPIAAHTIETAAKAGASRIILVVGYEQETVREYFGTEYAGLPIEYAVQETRQGTADAVRAAADRLDPGPFAVLNGDALYDGASLADLYETVPSVGAVRVDDPTQYGVLETTTEEPSRVTNVIEKPSDPPSDLVNTGAYVFPGAAREWLEVAESERGERELTDVLRRTCEASDVRAVPFERWMDIGYPWDLLAANELTLADCDRAVRGTVSDDAHVRGAVVIEEDVTIEPGVVIEGPAYIGREASIGPNAYIRGATHLGPGVKIGHGVEVKNSVVRHDTNIGHLSYVGDSVLGADVNFGAGTNVANLRHDGEVIATPVKGEMRSTGRRKFGVVVGDRTKTGIDTSLNAGVKLGADTHTKPGETVVRDRG